MTKQKRETLTFESDYEILSCLGNVTQKDKKPLIHAHIVIGDEKGKAFGGHLLPGCVISVTGETFLVEAQETLIRSLDNRFQLSLIKID